MKKAFIFFFTLCSLLINTPAVAAQLTCSASDHGWEEHWRGHSNCGECLQKHGNCVETCSISYYTCEARGVDYRGNSITIKGSGEDRWDAERNALRLCQRNFKNCSNSTCNSASEQVSRRDCPKP